MNVRFFRITACYALASAGLTLAMLLPGTLNAGNPAAKPQPIAAPTLQIGGVNLSAHLSTTQPAVELVAINTTDKPVTVPWGMAMTDPGKMSMGSRVGPTPLVVWRDAGTLTLKPGETQTLTLATKGAPAQGAKVGLYLSSNALSIQALPVAATAQLATDPLADVATTQPAQMN